MYLFLIVTILSFLSVYTSIFALPVIKWLSQATAKERRLIEERLALKQEQASIPMVDNFAKYAKIQRKINAIEVELEESKRQRNSKIFYARIFCVYGFKLGITIALVFLSFYYRSTPLITLDKKYNLYPFSNIIAYPNEPNSVSVHCWIICCTTVARLIKI